MDPLADVEKTAKLIRNAIREIPDTHKENTKELEKLQGEIQDLMHVIEFTNFNAHQGWRHAKELKEARIRRRELKNQNELIEPLLLFFKKTRNYLGELDNIVTQVQNNKHNQEQRTYKCRVREDLQNKF